LLALPVAAMLATVGLGSSPAAGSASTAAAASIPAARPCPAAFPVASLRAGMSATGYTVSTGTTPKPFAVTVLGVLHDGIAPGIDLIVVKASSPAIRAAGGIWAGMSGSPVYAGDGRLIGAVSYGLSFAPSRTAGLTPAGAMYKLLTMRTAPSLPMAEHVAVPSGLAARMVTEGAATAAAATSGLEMLRVPVSASGLSSRRLPAVQRKLDKATAAPTLVYAGSSSSGGVADTSKVRPGGNFAAALSVGDITFAGIGTTTAVCGGRVLAFGHPFFGSGRSTVSMHLAQAIVVQRDLIGGPYKLANVTGVIGKIGQDRLVGVRGWLGHPPRTAVIHSDVAASTGLHRRGTTYVSYQPFVPDIAAYHLEGNIDATLQKFDRGRSWLSWTAYGNLPNGTTWHLSHTTRVASEFDISFETADEMFFPLYRIINNRFTHVHVNHIRMVARAKDTFLAYTLGRVYVKTTGDYTRVTRRTVLNLQPGETFTVRAVLRPYDSPGPGRVVYRSLTVPSDTSAGSGTLQVAGGESARGFGSSPSMFRQLLRQIARQPRYDSVVVHLTVPGAAGKARASLEQRKVVDRVVSGSLGIRVVVAS
jgi:hypothetical protein